MDLHRSICAWQRELTGNQFLAAQCLFNRKFNITATKLLLQNCKNSSQMFSISSLGGSKKRRQKLEDDVENAKREDAKASADELRQYKNIVQEWQDDVTTAKRVLQGDVEAFKEVISEYNQYALDGLVGTGIKFLFYENFVHAKPEIHTDEVVPSFRRKQLASGRLSETKMPTSQFNELYQDYAASVSFKIAGDLFNLLPISEVYVTCYSRMLNSETGYVESMPITSVQFVKETYISLNLDKIDPSDALRNFRHEMHFSRTKGFSPVTPLLDE